MYKIFNNEVVIYMCVSDFDLIENEKLGRDFL